ncbi:hydroxylysine kinase [Prorops nasuta]|uniref:hydroxylysine kinase n=1 Tax=Prorops nasuta TaxID=863751 RepID=UPI0034CEE00A
MDEGNVLLFPGQIIRPPVTKETPTLLMEKLYKMKIKNIKELNAYDDKNYHILCYEDHTNPYISTIEEHGYVLKIVNSIDSKKKNVIEAHNEILRFLNHNGICCPLPIKNINDKYYSLETLESTRKNVSGNEKYAVKLLVYRPGELLSNVPATSDLMFKVGQFASSLTNCLAKHNEPALSNYQPLWSLASVPRLREFIYVVKNDEDIKMVNSVISKFEKEVLQEAWPNLEKGIIHGDLNEQNIILNHSCNDISAVIDFGDTQMTCVVFELAILMCYMILHAKDINIGKFVIQGYQSNRKLTELSKKILVLSVCARLCQSVVIGAYSYNLDSGNEYLLITQKYGWIMLRKLWKMNQNEILHAWGLKHE